MPIKDRSKYPKEWKTEIRPRILARAGNKCEQCKAPDRTIVCRGMVDGIHVWQDDDGIIYNATNGERVGSDYCGEVWNEKDGGLVRIVLTIAHLDHNPENNDESNLKALCQRCHLHLDIEQHRANARATRNKNKGLQELF